ncbi:carboxymuconolactone decarboxylase family protein [Mycobacterium sp. URHB0044]|uniref:carboxymuconolactone decarboxylase family protein n=1 Tax=Mycobacterium sp. URHB0044 TaxID=1380386 RepID=UPI0007E8DBEF|nr:carboxymuconolactone decarboxylase family protein [Mycobacterium sp. URHB0044]
MIIGEVSRKDVTDPRVLRCYEFFFGPDRDPTVERGTETGSLGNYWTVLANSPKSLEFVDAITALMVHGEGRFRVLKELGLVRACWLRGSQFTYSQHCKFLRTFGIPDEKIKAISYWGHSEHYTDPVERLVLSYTDDLIAGNGRVPDETMHALRKHFSDGEIVEMTYVIGTYGMCSTVLKAFRAEFDDRDDPVVEVPGAFPESRPAEWLRGYYGDGESTD